MAITMAACGEGNQSEQVESDGIQTAEQRRTEIAQMEGEMKGVVATPNDQKSIALTQQLLRRYRDYISVNPRDSISAEYLFKAADLSVGVGDPEGAVKYVDRLITEFPNFRKAPEMMLFKGFVYEVHMNNHAEAVKAYEAMIERYPNHRLTNDARAAIENLSLSEEELLEKLKRAEQTRESS